jgi:hypothetical protein
MWEEWGIWERINAAWAAVPPQSRACETKPIAGHDSADVDWLDGLTVWYLRFGIYNLAVRHA